MNLPGHRAIRTSAHPYGHSPRGRIARRTSAALITTALAATILVGCAPSTGVEPTWEPDEDAQDVVVRACDLAVQALGSVTSTGASEETMTLTSEFLDAAAAAATQDQVLLYYASYVGDAFRGSNPAATLPYMLSDVVSYCGG